MNGKLGEVWVWSAIDPENKYLFPDFVGERKRKIGRKVLNEIKSRRKNTDDLLLIQTDGYDLYKELVIDAFATKKINQVKRRGEMVTVTAEMPENILFCMLQKKRDDFGNIDAIDVKVIFGNEDKILKVLKNHNPTQGINTSYIERSNLNRRLFNSRLRRKTLSFSKNYNCLVAQLNLQRIYANFCWNHHTLRKKYGIPTSPAMAIEATNHIWSLNEIFFYPISR